MTKLIVRYLDEIVFKINVAQIMLRFRCPITKNCGFLHNLQTIMCTALKRLT